MQENRKAQVRKSSKRETSKEQGRCGCQDGVHGRARAVQVQKRQSERDNGRKEMGWLQVKQEKGGGLQWTFSLEVA